jgi:DNA-binding NtrC family response regulator
MARLLIVDDERNIHVRLASFFEGCDHVVQTAESGKEALELLFRNEPADLVLTDYRMAELNGVELLQQIKRQAPDTTVILMTAYGTIENAAIAMKAGAYDYLAKPFSLEQVQHVVERALELRDCVLKIARCAIPSKNAPCLSPRAPLCAVCSILRDKPRGVRRPSC